MTAQLNSVNLVVLFLVEVTRRTIVLDPDKTFKVDLLVRFFQKLLDLHLHLLVHTLKGNDKLILTYLCHECKGRLRINLEFKKIVVVRTTFFFLKCDL